MSVVTYNYPTRIRFGEGARHELTAVLQSAGVKRPLLFTDRGVAALPWFDDLAEEVSKSLDTARFSDMGGNPIVRNVDAGVAAARAHRADAIVAIGGGAPVDVAKAVALMLHHPGHLFDYEDGKPDGLPVDQPIPYIVALPTTAGTGSEVGRSSVISDNDTHQKKIIFTPRILPAVVLADPELTLGLPAHLTAATGIDALTHLVEAFLAKGHHPMADGMALEGIRLVAGALEKAVAFAKAGHSSLDAAQKSAHISARRAMLDASMMGAIAFQKGLGVNHSCAHALSTVCDTHHGLANGLMLPAAMRFNYETVPDRFLRMARVIDADASSGTQFISWLESICEGVGIPTSLKAAGIPITELDRLVEVAFADGCHPSNPRAVTPDDLRAIYLEAFGE